MDTKIKVGKYTLNIDRYCMWITEQKVSENGKEREERVTGYFRNLDDLLEDFIKKSKAKDCSTMAEVICEIKFAEDQAIKMAKAYLNENMRNVRVTNGKEENI